MNGIVAPNSGCCPAPCRSGRPSRFRNRPMPIAVYALTVGAFGIGTTEFIIMGLLLQVAADMHVGVSTAGLLISGYALGVFVGAPLLTLASRRMPRKAVLLALMAIFTLGNATCALAPSYGWLMAARVLTSLAHGTFFGVAFGAWLGLLLGWRAAFWAVAAIGVIAFAILAVSVPGHLGRDDEPTSLRDEVGVLARPQVLLGLAMTVFGFAGLFTVFTYIQPILTRISGFSQSAVSPVLLVLGAGLAVGNVMGGRFADRGLARALIGTLAVLAIVLGALGPALGTKIPTVLLVGLLGVAAFATVAPLQLRVLEKSGSAGQNLASSLNIAAFNLGNALGAWAGGVTIDAGLGFAALPLVAAAITLLGLALALWSVQLDRRLVSATA